MLKDPKPKGLLPFAEAISAATALVEKEQKERPLTPFDNPSNSDDNDNGDKPKYKDVFGSFGV